MSSSLGSVFELAVIYNELHFSGDQLNVAGLVSTDPSCVKLFSDH
jgi:hypothetical protein